MSLGSTPERPRSSTANWAATDEIYLGAEISTDNLTPPSDMGGWIKWRQDADVQAGWPFLAAAAAGA